MNVIEAEDLTKVYRRYITGGNKGQSERPVPKGI